MFRSFALAVGITMCLIGAECLLIEKVVWASEQAPAETTQRSPIGFLNSSTPQTTNKEFVPPEWMPWSLLSAGAVTILYSFTIPRRIGAD